MVMTPITATVFLGMMRSGAPPILGSAIGLVIGTVVLLVKRRIADLAVFYALFGSVPAYISWVVMPAASGAKSVWLSLPVVIMLPLWAMSGLALITYAVGDQQRSLCEKCAQIGRRAGDNLNRRSGKVGLCAFIIATIAWFDAAVRPEPFVLPSTVDWAFVMLGWVAGVWYNCFAGKRDA